MKDLQAKISVYKNEDCLPVAVAYPDSLKAILDIKDVSQTVNEIKQWPSYQMTPLMELRTLAQEIGVDNIWYKDESRRFGLGSFKALGGAYAVAHQIRDYLKREHQLNLETKDLLTGEYKHVIQEITVSCATDGNHGRSVAWGAQLFGCSCVIYLHNHVSKGRESQIRSYGAEIVRVEGNYDDSVRQAEEDAQKLSRIIISDTSYEGYTEIPKQVALGYTVMFEEIEQQLQGEIPTHLFVQGGVGGLASAACGYFWQKWKDKRPVFIIVEPEEANCLQVSAINHQPTVVGGELETLMAGLACGEVSPIAWEILSKGTDYFLTVNEASVAPSMRLLAALDIEAGESAVAGLAALSVAINEPQLGLNAQSRVLLLGTEGATDPEIYQKLVNA